MTVTSTGKEINLNILVNSTKKLKKEIKKNSSLDEASLLHYVSSIIELRNELDTYHNENYENLFIIKVFKKIGICEKNLNKAQSILLKNASNIIENNNASKLHQTIKEVWEEKTQGSTKDAHFGKSLLENKKKDPILLLALSQHLRRLQLEELLVVLAKEKNPEKFFEIYKHVNQNDRIAIEDSLLKIYGQNLSDLIDSQITSFNEIMIEVLELFLLSQSFKSDDLIKPHLHHCVSITYFQYLEACLNNQNETDFLYFFASTLQKKTTHDFDLEYFKLLIKQNINHPLVIEAVNVYLLQQLTFFENSLEKKNWNKALQIYNALPKSLKNNIIHKIELIRLNQKNIFDGAKHFVSNNFRKLNRQTTLKPFEKSAKLLNSCFKKGKYNPILKKALHTEINEFQEKIQELQKEKNATEFTKIKGLYYSIFTIYETNTNINPILDENLRLAYEAMSYAIRKVPYSSNFSDRENTLFNKNNIKTQTLDDFSKLMKSSRQILVYEQQAKILNKKTNTLHNKFSIKISDAKVGEHYPLGNCDELTSVVFAYLTKQKKDNLNVEIFNIRGNTGDHLFCVIGRDKSSDPKNHQSFGPHAVICDPWARKIYPATLIEDLLDDFTGKINNGLPVTKKFDPIRQFLNLVIGNILTVKELEKAAQNEQIQNKSQLVELLSAFETSSSDDKPLLANMILDFLSLQPAYDQENSVLSILTAQMNYYLYSKIEKNKKLSLKHSF